MSSPLVLTVPITALYLDVHKTFFHQHNCTIQDTRASVGNARLYRVTFPSGTQKIPHPQADIPRSLLILPDGLRLLEVRAGGASYSFLIEPFVVPPSSMATWHMLKVRAPAVPVQ